MVSCRRRYFFCLSVGGITREVREFSWNLWAELTSREKEKSIGVWDDLDLQILFLSWTYTAPSRFVDIDQIASSVLCGFAGGGLLFFMSYG